MGERGVLAEEEKERELLGGPAGAWTDAMMIFPNNIDSTYREGCTTCHFWLSYDGLILLEFSSWHI